MNLPSGVTGEISPYPTVVIVTIAPINTVGDTLKTILSIFNKVHDGAEYNNKAQHYQHEDAYFF